MICRFHIFFFKFRQFFNGHIISKNVFVYFSAQSGSYVYIHSNYYTSDEGDIAKLKSGHISAHQQCFSFWYFTTNSRDSVHVFQNQNVLLDLSTDKYEKGKWHHIKISLEKTSFSSFQLVFKVRRGIWNYSRPFGAIVIDDILIENTMCNCKYSRIYYLSLLFHKHQ